MPGMLSLPHEQARLQSWDMIELKIDGCRITYDGNDLYSDRMINRSERFPHIVQQLANISIKCRGEIAIPGGNILQLSKRQNWYRACFYIFDIYELVGLTHYGRTLSEKRILLNKVLTKAQLPNIFLPQAFESFDDGWKYVTENESEGLVLKNNNGMMWKVKRQTEEKLKIIGYIPGKSKGAFLIERNGIQSKVSGTSDTYVKAYHALKALNKDTYAEIEYLFLTDDGIPYQPKLRRLGTMEMLQE